MAKAIRMTPEQLDAYLAKKGARPPAKKAKYGNRRVFEYGYWFDSLREAKRYGELLLLQKAGKIGTLLRQTPFAIRVEGELICTYIADFVYVDLEADRRTLEDVKGVRTEVYKLKKKLMKAVYGIEIKEV